MSTTNSTTKKRSVRRRKTKPNLLPLLAGLAVVCALAASIVMLENSLSPSATEPSESTAPTQMTLPPNVYRPEDFAYDDRGYLTCTAGQYAIGLDVSEQQYDIDWQQVAEAGMEFAFVRIGYRGYTQGAIYPDEYAEKNLRGAKDAGLKVGAYFYSQAVTTQEAAQEAAYCAQMLQGFELDLPVVFDWEYVSEEARTGGMDSETLTQCARAFCEKIEAAGFDAMIYANWHHAQELFDMLQLQEYPFWLAMYSDVMDYPYRVDVWQYTDAGSVPGIETPVDMDLMLIYD